MSLLFTPNKFFSWLCAFLALSLLSAEEGMISVDGLELDVKSDLASLGEEDPIAIFQQATFSLSAADNGVLLPVGAEGGTTLEFLLADAPPGDYSLDALRSLQSQVVKYLSKSGYYGIVVVADPDQIDLHSGEDLREGEKSLNLQVWFSKVVLQRTIAKGNRIKGSDLLNHPLHRSVLAHSPFVSDPELDASDDFLIDKLALDNYLERLNQHPRRRVDAALSSSGKPGEVVLDYIVSEAKPWLVYMQVSNTGTEATGEWRERIGGVYYQLTGNDDILTLDYLTAEFDRANAFLASYELPLLKPDYLSTKIYGTYNDFAAENIEFKTLDDAVGETTTYGGELVYKPFYYKEHVISATLGVKYEELTTENISLGRKGNVKLLSPYARLQAAKQKQVHRSVISVGYEISDNTSYIEDELAALGRSFSTVDYELLTFNLYQSFFLEPLFSGYHQVDAGSWLANSLVHELAFSFRGQYALDDARLITQKQYFGGGFFSVRGYNESTARGDSGFTGSAEYRIHLARLLRPASLLETIDPKEQASDTEVRNRFNYRAPSLYGLPDWDFLVRGFVDLASLSINQPEKQPQEIDQDLLSAGLGLEFQYRANLNIRLDYGVVINGLEDFAGESIKDAESGDSRFHFLATYSF